VFLENPKGGQAITDGPDTILALHDGIRVCFASEEPAGALRKDLASTFAKLSVNPARRNENLG
jgi:hypothetical protein